MSARDREWGQRQSAWDRVWMIIVIVGALGVGVWWLESRFGSFVAIVVLGALLGVMCLIVGWLLSLATQRSTLDAAAQFNDGLAETEKYRQQTYREDARGAREAFSARARLDVIDEQRIQRLAQQQARLMIEQERKTITQRPDQQFRVIGDENNVGEWD
jgi:hypothetical protein